MRSTRPTGWSGLLAALCFLLPFLPLLAYAPPAEAQRGRRARRARRITQAELREAEAANARPRSRRRRTAAARRREAARARREAARARRRGSARARRGEEAPRRHEPSSAARRSHAGLGGASLLRRLRALEARLAEIEAQAQQLTPAGRDHTDLSAMQLDPNRPLPRVTANVTLRYDNFIVGDDLNEVGGEDYLGGFRTRVRVGAVYQPEDSFVIGGLRLAVGENPNPAASFVPIGDVTRTTSLGFDQYFFSLRPLEERSRLRFTFGKMPNPLFTGWDGVGWRSELVFDQDINPSGVAVAGEIIRNEDIVLTDTAAYFVVQDIEDLNFAGRSGPVSMVVNQLQVETSFLSAALTYYHYANLNSGLLVTGTNPVTGEMDDQDPENAFLFREGGLQDTNNLRSYGTASGFFLNDWNLLQLTAQGKLTLSTGGPAGELRLFGMLDYIYNLSATRDQNGVGATLGAHLGGWEEGQIPPLDLWLTYRYVEADATLAAFADGDLGGGTDYQGIEIGAGLFLDRSVRLVGTYFDFQRAPQMSERVQRFFFDLIWSY